MYRLWYYIGKNSKWNYKVYRIWSSIGKLFNWDKRVELEYDKRRRITLP